MALSETRRQELYGYCRIDVPTPEDAALIDILYTGAVGYLSDAGVRVPPAGTARRAKYDLCVNYMVLDGYDHREMTVPAVTMDNPAFRRILNQMKLTEPAEAVEHGQ